MIKKILKQHLDYNNESIVQIKTVSVSEKLIDPKENYHYHNFYQIVIVHNGTLEFIVNDIPFIIDGNSVLMFGSDLPHGVVNVSNDAKLTVIYIPFEVLLWINKFNEMRGDIQFINDSKGGYLFSSDIINRKISLLSRKIKNSRGFKRISLLFELLYTLYKEKDNVKCISKSKRDASNSLTLKQSPVEKVIYYLHNHFKEETELGVLAKIAGQNPSSLCRNFKKRTGDTISQFVNRLRIESACNLLIDTELSISEVAFHVGFNTFSHFSTQFLKYVGMSPSEYRNRIEK